MKSIFQRALRNHNIQALVVLCVGALLALWLYHEPKLLLDDWAQIISDSVFGNMRWVEWSRRRPLDWFAHQAIISLFGINIPVFYLANFIIVLGVFYMVYILADRLLPGLYPYSLVVALIAMIYPADLSLTWITMINIRLSWLVTLFGMWLLLEYANRGGVWRLILAGLCTFLPLWAYEGSIGIITAWCILLAIISRQAPLPRRLALLTPLLLIASFGAMRIIIRPMMGIGDSNVNSFYNVSFDLLIDRLAQIVILIYAWIQPFLEVLNRFGLSGLATRVTLVGVSFLIVICILVMYAFLRISRLVDNPPFSASEKVRRANTLGGVILIAIIFVFAGYVPMLLIYAPNLEDVSSRANMYAIPGSAAIITALIGLIAVVIAKSNKQWQAMVWAGTIPLIILGLGTQIHIHQREQLAWHAQKTIWHELFQIAPNFEDGTTVVLLMPGNKQLGIGERPPLSAEWEVNHALKVLYENNTLTGRIIFPRAEFYSEARLTPDGVLGARQQIATPFAETVFIKYNPKNGTVSLVQNLRIELGLSFNVSSYEPLNRIWPIPRPTWRYRYLIENPDVFDIR